MGALIIAGSDPLGAAPIIIGGGGPQLPGAIIAGCGLLAANPILIGGGPPEGGGPLIIAIPGAGHPLLIDPGYDGGEGFIPVMSDTTSS